MNRKLSVEQCDHITRAIGRVWRDLTEQGVLVSSRQVFEEYVEVMQERYAEVDRMLAPRHKKNGSRFRRVRQSDGSCRRVRLAA